MIRLTISIRATILSLRRFDIALPAVTKRTEKEWAKYRAENRLDLPGRSTSTAESVGNDSICAHATPEVTGTAYNAFLPTSHP
jgi:hypothetical protein